jgi:hypothetical protein
VNVLITSARMPFALDEVRKFGRRGHRVFAADTFGAAPGAHSHHVAARLRVASPQHAPARFIADVKQILIEHRIDLLLPCFEEVFYLARHLPELAQLTQVFTSELDTLARLHRKSSFNALARQLGIAVPETIVVEDQVELLRALGAWRRYVARPAYSRGGLQLLTNTGPLAGALAVGACRPTRARPWIVQPYVDGTDVCSFSVSHHGRVVAHCAYVHPMEIEHRGGIVFESVAEPGTLDAVARLVEATGYHGQLGADFRRTADRSLVALECNPRPTAGVHMMADALLVDAVVAPSSGRVRVVPAGIRRKYNGAVLRDLVLHGTRLGEHLALLLSRYDVDRKDRDRMPSLYQLLSYVLTLGTRARRHRAAPRGTSLMAAYFDGVEWNGEEIP